MGRGGLGFWGARRVEEAGAAVPWQPYCASVSLVVLLKKGPKLWRKGAKLMVNGASNVARRSAVSFSYAMSPGQIALGADVEAMALVTTESKAVARGVPAVGVSRKGARRASAKGAAKVRAAATPAAEDVPNMGRRVTMNWLVVGAWSAPVATMAYGFLDTLVPPK